MTVIDVHTHFTPPFMAEEAAREGGLFGVRAEDGFLIHPEGFRYPIHLESHDVGAKLAGMDEAEIDAAVLSLIPPLFFYEQPADEAVPFARRANDALAEMVDGEDRLLAFAHLPLQAPEEAAAELDRAVDELGFRGAHIGTDAGPDLKLDARELDPIWAAAERHDLPIVLHPSYVGLKPGLEDFYFTNSIGNPLETTTTAARLIHAGTLDRFPSLKLVLVHAGGYLPYQIGRFDHAYDVRNEPKVSLDRRPSEYLDRFYMDTITHAEAQLDFLASLIGTERLVLGTDIPFDMGDPRPLDLIRRTSVDENAIGATAASLLRLDGAA
jgi:aminocarboxymuconate-semialdehyde decarboxylase